MKAAGVQKLRGVRPDRGAPPETAYDAKYVQNKKRLSVPPQPYPLLSSNILHKRISTISCINSRKSETDFFAGVKVFEIGQTF